MAVLRAPGRANLIGEHTDHTDGLVLPVALDRAITVTVTAAAPRIVMTSDVDATPVDVAADGSDPPATGWGRYVAAVAAELAALGRPAVGLRGHVTSDLPAGAGLSSSAALEVAVALALLEVAGERLDPLDLAAAARRAELRAVGVPCGLMDPAASVLGRAGHAVLLDCGTLAHRLVALPDDLAVVILDTGVRRTLEGSDYAARSRELASALPALGGRRPADVDPDELDGPGGLLAAMPAVPARRVRHVVTENARVRATVAALDAGDVQALGPLLAASHASLRDDYEVVVPELDTMVALALDAGALAARMTGAGFGGAVVALCAGGDAVAIGTEVIDRYHRRHPERTGAAIVTRAADGAGPVASPVA